jgi:hypothetical protein
VAPCFELEEKTSTFSLFISFFASMIGLAAQTPHHVREHPVELGTRLYGFRSRFWFFLSSLQFLSSILFILFSLLVE